METIIGNHIIKNIEQYETTINNEDTSQVTNNEDTDHNKDKILIPVSMLSDYDYCPRKLFLTKIKGIKEPETKATLIGTITHMCFLEANKIEEDIVKSITKQTNILKLYKDRYDAILRKILYEKRFKLEKYDLSISSTFDELCKILHTEAEFRAANISNFIKLNNIYESRLWDELTPKFISEFNICSEALKIKGRIDKIGVFKAGNKNCKDALQYVVYELKSKSPQKDGIIWKSEKIQLGAYMLITNDVYKQNIDYGFIQYLKDGTILKLSMNPALKDEILNYRDKVMQLLASHVAPPLINNENKCRLCGINKICFAYRDNNDVKDKIR